MTFNFNVYHSLQKFLAVCLHLYCFQYILIASDFGFCQSRLKHFAEDNPDFELLSGSKHFLLLKTKKWGFDFQKDIFYSLFLLDVYMISQKQSMGIGVTWTLTSFHVSSIWRKRTLENISPAWSPGFLKHKSVVHSFLLLVFVNVYNSFPGNRDQHL